MAIQQVQRRATTADAAGSVRAWCEVGALPGAPERCAYSEYVRARHRPATDGVSAHGPKSCTRATGGRQS